MFWCGMVSSVGIAADYGLDGPGIDSRWSEIFRPCRPALGPTQPPIQWVPGLSPGVKHSRGVLLTTHPLLVPWSWKTRAIKADSHLACRAHAVPLLCRAAKGLECLSHLIYRVRPCLIHTCHAMPMPCSDRAVLLNATAQHGRLSMAVLCCGLEKNGMVRA